MELNYTLNDLNIVVNSILKYNHSNLFLFHGTMGVGKTTLIKALVKALGSSDDVQSPTYSLVNEYHSANGLIYHFDLYRVNDIEEIYNIGFEDYLSEDHIILIEWPELVEEILPDDVVHIYLEMDDFDQRNITIKSKMFNEKE